MSAVMDRFNQGQSNDEILKIQEETYQKMAEFVKLATQFNETTKQMYNIEVTSSKEEGNESAIEKISGNVEALVTDGRKSSDTMAKLANPKELVKANKKDGLLKRGFYKLIGWGIKKLVKKFDKGGLFEKANKTKDVAAQAGKDGKPGDVNNNANVDAQAAAQMGQAIGGIMAKNLSPAKLVGSFLKVMLPKIILFLVLLTIFIQAWFDTDIKTAFTVALAIVTNGFLIYIGWQVAKTLFKIAFEMACTAMVTGAKIAAVATELAMSFMVYAAFLIIIPLILLCFVLLVAIIAVVIIAILYAVIEIVKVVSDVILKAAEMFFDFLGKWLFGTTDKADTQKETKDSVNATEEVNKALLAFTNAATEAVARMVGITETVQLSCIAIIAELAVGMGMLTIAALAWLVNPFMMMALAAATAAGSIANMLSGKTSEDTNQFEAAIKPLLEVTTDIRNIVKSFAKVNEQVINKTLSTRTKISSNDINNVNTMAPSDESTQETVYVNPNGLANDSTAEIRDLIKTEIAKQTEAIVNAITLLTNATKENKRSGFFGI